MVKDQPHRHKETVYLFSSCYPCLFVDFVSLNFDFIKWKVDHVELRESANRLKHLYRIGWNVMSSNNNNMYCKVSTANALQKRSVTLSQQQQQAEEQQSDSEPNVWANTLRQENGELDQHRRTVTMPRWILRTFSPFTPQPCVYFQYIIFHLT